MATTAFIIRIGKISVWLKSLIIYFVVKVDDAHFWGEQLFFKVFMLHERLSAGDSVFSSIYAVVMKALIPSYPEVLGDNWGDAYENLYHVTVPIEEFKKRKVLDKPKQVYIIVYHFLSHKLGFLTINPVKTFTTNLKNSLQLFQKEIYGQLELYKENFK